MDTHEGIVVSRTPASTAILPNRFVIPTGNVDEVTQVSAANADATGVLLGSPDTRLPLTQRVRVAISGLAPVEAGAAIADGQDVITDNVGRAIPDPQTGATTSLIRGKAQGAVSSGDAAAGGAIVSILLAPSRAKY